MDNIAHQCEHEGCKATETAAYHNQWEELTPDGKWQEEWYCDEHAVQNGFCLGCTYLRAGTEDYDFSPIKGWCGECVDELRSEAGEYVDDDLDFGWDYAADWYDPDSPVSELEPPETPTVRWIGPGSEMLPE